MEASHNQDRILDKIQKLLALGESANPNEAAIALDRARRLMQEHNISMTDVSIGGISEYAEDIPSLIRARNLYTTLGWIVSKSFGCRIVYNMVNNVAKKAVFIGPKDRAQGASYAFTILARQAAVVKKAFVLEQKRKHLETLKAHYGHLYPISQARTLTEAYRLLGWLGDSVKSTIEKHLRSSTKAYLHGWMVAIAEKVQAFALDNEEQELIDAYLEHKHADVVEMRKARVTRYTNEQMSCYQNGVRDGTDGFDLLHGVSTDVQRRSIGHN